MGLFDYVELSFDCPACSYKKNKREWQTNSLQNSLFAYKAGDRISIPVSKKSKDSIEIHTICPGCRKFIEAKVKIEKGKIIDQVDYPRMRRAKRKTKSKSKR